MIVTQAMTPANFRKTLRRLVRPRGMIRGRWLPAQSTDPDRAFARLFVSLFKAGLRGDQSMTDLRVLRP
jgi:hypothetical protein